MRAKFLVSAALCALLLAGCNQAGGPRSAPSGYLTEESVSAADTATMTPEQREKYAANPVSPVRRVAEAPVSTFAVDVDTAAYSNVRRFLNEGQTPPRDAVRTEELINYFRYDYPLPANRAEPFSVTTDVARTPWNPETRLPPDRAPGLCRNARQRAAAERRYGLRGRSRGLRAEAARRSAARPMGLRRHPQARGHPMGLFGAGLVAAGVPAPDRPCRNPIA
jgi:Ca-activated chloride channel homolog